MFLVFEGSFKQVADGLKVVNAAVVGGGAHIDQTELIEQVRHIVKTERFDRIDLRNAADDFFEKIFFIDFRFGVGAVDGADDRSRQQVEQGGRKALFVVKRLGRHIHAVKQTDKRLFVVFVLARGLEVEPDAAGFAIAPNQDVGAGMFKQVLPFVDQVKKITAFKIEKRLVKIGNQA